uniref:Putative secreted peptide n=1 Tax=Anopheles braziliensis TaxID=58242 RepID=A0A2M3ZT42_9DIPT
MARYDYGWLICMVRTRFGCLELSFLVLAFIFSFLQSGRPRSLSKRERSFLAPFAVLDFGARKCCDNICNRTRQKQ